VSARIQAARTVCHWCHCAGVKAAVQPRERSVCATILQKFWGNISESSHILSTIWQSVYAVFHLHVLLCWAV